MRASVAKRYRQGLAYAGPCLLTGSRSLSTATKTALEMWADEISQIRYAGGVVAISETVRAALAACIH